MAGTNPAFNANVFRTNIRNTMIMGLPVKPTERATFYFPKVKTYDPPDAVLDEEGQPFDPTVNVVYTAPAPVQVPVAVDFSAPATEDEILAVGTFRTTRVLITLLDTEYEKVKNAVEVTLGDSRYNIAYTPPPVGLFDVTIYSFACFGIDEK